MDLVQKKGTAQYAKEIYEEIRRCLGEYEYLILLTKSDSGKVIKS